MICRSHILDDLAVPVSDGVRCGERCVRIIRVLWSGRDLDVQKTHGGILSKRTAAQLFGGEPDCLHSVQVPSEVIDLVLHLASIQTAISSIRASSAVGSSATFSLLSVSPGHCRKRCAETEGQNHVNSSAENSKQKVQSHPYKGTLAI